MSLRPYTAEDLDPVLELFEAAFIEPGEEFGADARDRVRRRFMRAAETDPDGAWVAEEDGRLVGNAVALRRGPIWVLSFLAVHKDTQRGGHGRALLGRSLEYAEGTSGQMLCASTHPAALHLYAAHGFSLLPSMAAHGPVDRSRLPAPARGVRPGTADDFELCAAIDEAVRGGSRTVDLEMLLETGTRLFVSERPRGYGLVADGRCYGVAAEDEETARALLWTVIAEGAEDGQARFAWVTAPQQWAVQVAVAAGLRLEPDGPVCVRGETGPLYPWLPNGALL